MEEYNWIDMMQKMQMINLLSKKIIRRMPKDCEISSQHLDVLSQILILKEEVTPAVLSRKLGVSKTIISRIIEDLHTKGYVMKTKDMMDKRRYFISLTSLGEKQLDAIYKHYLTPIYTLRRKLGNKDFCELIKAIENANIQLNDYEKEQEE